jgi:hypothetical protein
MTGKLLVEYAKYRLSMQLAATVNFNLFHAVGRINLGFHRRLVVFL